MGEDQKQKTSTSDLVFRLTPEVEQYRHDIRRFVDAMLYKLRMHANKGRWEGGTTDKYLKLLRDEVEELAQAVDERNTMEIMAEGADVANFAMIISSIAVEKG